MELIQLLKTVNSEVLVFTLATCFAFFSWLIKGLVETPLKESKATFSKYVEKRIHVLSEIKTRLRYLAYFPLPDDIDGKKHKEQIQEFLLKDGNAAYLNKETFETTLKLAITPETDEALLLKTIREIDEDLYGQVSKIRDEIAFYRKYSNYNPLKRVLAFAILALYYSLLFVLIGVLIVSLVSFWQTQNSLVRLFLLSGFVLTLILTNKLVLKH